MAPEGEKVRFGISIEQLESGVVRLTLPGGDVIKIRPLRNKKSDSEKVNIALGVARLAIPLAFPKESTGVGDVGFLVESQDDINNLPFGYETYYKDALDWAGPVLMKGRYSAEEVAKIISVGIPQYQTAKNLSDGIEQEALKIKVKRLRDVLAEHYPGFKSANKRRKPVPSW